MGFGTQPRRPPQPGGPPAWFVFLIGTALVFGIYYLWSGVQTFLRTGGLGVAEATQQARIISTATAASRSLPTLPARPSFTPQPTCEDFLVSVPSAIVRAAPSTNAAVVTSLRQNEAVCVIGRPAPDSEWYMVDSNPRTRRLEAAYMHQSVIQAVYPTPTATLTATAAPTVTLSPTPVPSATPRPRPTSSPDPAVPTQTDTPRPTPSFTPSPPRQSAFSASATPASV